MNAAWLRSRFSNALRCYTGYALSLCGLVRIKHMPLFVSVEPAAVCQLRCPACPVGMHKNAAAPARNNAAFMSFETWQRVLSEIRDTAFVVQFYFQGEPLLNRDLPQMIAEAHEAGLYTVVSTNAQAMTPALAEQLVNAGLDRIIVSMDGLTDASYGAYRIGGSLEKTKEALRSLRQAKDRKKAARHIGRCVSPVIELQCLRLRSNEHEWSRFRREYRALGADRLVFKTAQLYDYGNGHPLMPSDQRYSRYVQGADGRYYRRELRKGCRRIWSGCVITAAGEVLPCCYDKEHRFSYGNIMDAPLRGLFANDKAMAFRRAALLSKPNICHECWK